ncbi:Lrp/AsnC family transcriptional regulator [Actinophytocola glycyrrhizae]|uniref:Lrp/AsnC family transcriptional regulator n=1 Tax=Actinophytocola glycyrrhizae TaxID=2044873 RepID=A0ABV9SE10_9PSEU
MGSRKPADGQPDTTAFAPVDDLSRRILAVLQDDGRADLTAVAKACGTSLPTVARRVERLIADDLLRVAVIPELGSHGPVETLMAQIVCQPGTQVSVAQKLVVRQDVRFAALVAGSYDIVLELVVEAELSGYPRAMLEIQSIPGIERWHSDLVLHVYKISHHWKKPDRGTTDDADYPFARTMCDPSHLDGTDLAILDVLQKDGRASFKSIAAGLGVNESTVRRRFERMTNNGCALVVTIVPPAALGLRALTLMTVNVEPRKLDDVAGTLARHPSVRYLAATLGGSTLMCEVVAESTKGLFEFSKSTLATLDGVVDWAGSLELVTLKRAFVETPWWRTRLATSKAPLTP